MDKTDKNKTSKQVELAALFEDLQDTLNQSILNENAESKIKPPNTSAAKNNKTTITITPPVTQKNYGSQDSVDSFNNSENIQENIEAPVKRAAVGVKEREKSYARPDVKTENINSTKKTVSSEFSEIFDDIKSGGKSYKNSENTGEIRRNTAGFSGSISRADNTEYKDYTDGIDDIDDTDNTDNLDNQDNMDYRLLEALSKEHSDYTGKYEVEIPSKTVKQKNPVKSPPEKKFAGLSGLFRVSSKEYISREQNDDIFKKYQKIYIGEFIKLLICGLLFLGLLYLEIAPFISFLKLPDVLIFYSSVYILIDFQILLFAAWTMQKSLIFGLKSILKSELNLYASAAIFFVFAAAHSIAVYFMKINNVQAVLFNSVAVLAIFCISLYNILDIDFEITGFKAVSSKKLKYALRLDTNASDEREMFRDIIPQNTAIGRISKTAFASNFFSRTARYKNHGESVRFYIYISLAAAAVMAVVYIIMKQEVYRILSAAAFLFFGSVPLCSFISSAYPAFRAQKKAHESGAAFIGTDSIEESAEIAILSIADKDIFPPPSVKLARVYGNNKIDDVLHYLCLLFAELNLPAAETETFKTQLEWDSKKSAAANIQINEFSDYGICYTTNGVTLYAGKSEYIENLGLRPHFDPDFDEQFLKSSGSMMFLALETEVIAKIYLKYELTVNFHDILKNIRKMNSCVCIKTFDPNIDDSLLHKLANIRKFPIKVLKLKDKSEVYQIAEKAESGVVSKDSLKSVISALLIASRTKTTMKTNTLIQGIAFAASLIMTVCIILFAPAGLYNAGILIAAHLFWAATITFLSALSP